MSPWDQGYLSVGWRMARAVNPFAYDSWQWRQWWQGRRAALLEYLLDDQQVFGLQTNLGE